MTLPTLSLLLASSGAFPVPEAPNAKARTEPAPFAEPEVSDEELAGMRGGVSLPNGVDVSIAVRTETTLDGNLLLRSVYQLNEGAPTVQAYAPAVGQVVPTRIATATGGSGASAPSVSVVFDRQSGVSFVQNAGAMPTINVTSQTPAETAVSNDGLTPLPVAAGPVETAGGIVTLQSLPGGSYTHLDGVNLEVSHLFGNALGAIVANTGSDRVIDTETTISLNLTGATPYNLGSTMMRVESIALDAVRSSIR